MNMKRQGYTRTELSASNIEPLTLSIADAAKRAGISRSLIYQEIKAGRLASAKLGKRRLIPLTALQEWLALATTAATSGIMGVSHDC